MWKPFENNIKNINFTLNSEHKDSIYTSIGNMEKEMI